jgi:hypothetical protein
MTRHSEASLVHVPYNWSYADETAREAASGFVLVDEGKLARQLDDNSLWMLISYSGPTWIAVGSGVGGGSGIPESGWIDKTGEVWTRRSQAFTNDPAAGSNIVLNMTNTQGFTIFDTVNVSSGAGNEDAKITAVVANTSITVDTLALNHTTSSPLVTHLNCFTVPADLTEVYTKGRKIRFKDGGSYKYGAIKASSFVSVTAVTMLPNTDFTIGSAAITDNYMSPIENPDGWPDWFNYAPIYSANGSMTFTSVTNNYAKWRCINKTVLVNAKATGTVGGTPSTALIVSLPVKALTDQALAGATTITDGGASLAGRCFLSTTKDGVISGRADATNWSAGSGRIVVPSISYEME